MKLTLILILVMSSLSGVLIYKKDDIIRFINKDEFQQILNIDEDITKQTITQTTQGEQGKQELEKTKKKTKEEINKEKVQEKIEKLRKKYALKSEIQIGESYLENKEYISALPKFLSILKEIPNEESIINNIGNIYFALNKFDNAYKYYERIKDYKHLDTYFALQTLIFSESETLREKNGEELKNQVDTLIGEIHSFPLSKQEKFYYENSLSCLYDLEGCKQIFEEYFTAKKETQNDETSEEQEEMIQELVNIENALQNYKNFKLDDIGYQNALLSGAFFSNGNYLIAIVLGEQILDNRPDYKPILKIVAKSLFQLGDYESTKKHLLKYKEVEPNEPEINYLLGVVYGKLREYVLSSLNLKRALEQGYEDSIETRRRMIYNYHKVGETERMLESFKEMIEEESEINIADIEIALYHHITNGKISEAKEINRFATTKFTTQNEQGETVIEHESILLGYLGWIQLKEIDIEGSQEIAEKNLLQAKIKDPEYPVTLFALGQIEEKKENKDEAKAYYEKIISLGTIEEFSELAEEAREQLSSK